MAFTPNGRMIVTSKPGQVYVYDQSGNELAGPALNLGPETCDNSERGLLGVAVDPKFGTDGHDFVYLYYTFKKYNVCPDKEPANKKNPVNRVSRFVMDGNTIRKDTEDVLIDNIKSPNGNHNAGDLHFGKDGNLYVSVGDGGCDYAKPTRCQYENGTSRDKNILNGKILRITPDGGIPNTNPFTGPNSARCNVAGRTNPDKSCKETYLKGFRNPFRFAVDPDANGTLLRINDVGGQRWEEIDKAKVGTSDDGNDYGWNLCEGRHDNPYRSGRVNCNGRTYTGPIHEYNHSTGCESITGGAFVPDGFWPARYDDAYLFADFVCGRIFSLTPKDGGGYHKEAFEGGMGQSSAVAMTFGPYRSTGRALYYASFENGGVIRRIAYTRDDQTPVASVDTVGENYGTSLSMNFDASGSRDPDGDASLTYLWDFGDGTTQTTDVPTNSHTYSQRDKYTVALTVQDNSGMVSDPARIDVFPGDTPPEPTIQSDDSTFYVDEPLTVNGSATDAEGDSFTRSWEVLQYHDGNHAHPWKSSDPGVDVGSFTFNGSAPEGLYSTDPDLNYLEVRMTATDSLGLSKTTTLQLHPETVEMTFEPRPSDLRLKVNGQLFRGPRTLISWIGYDLNVTAPRQKDPDGHLWGFRSWSDGGAATHVIETPQSPQTYTATFRRLRR